MRNISIIKNSLKHSKIYNQNVSHQLYPTHTYQNVIIICIYPQKTCFGISSFKLSQQNTPRTIQVCVVVLVNLNHILQKILIRRYGRSSIADTIWGRYDDSTATETRHGGSTARICHKCAFFIDDGGNTSLTMPCRQLDSIAGTLTHNRTNSALITQPLCFTPRPIQWRLFQTYIFNVFCCNAKTRKTQGGFTLSSIH